MFSIRHTDGSGHRLASDHQEEQLSDLYDELQSADQEHGDVAIKNQSDGWCISAHRDGSVVFGNLLEEPNDEHLYPVTKEQVMGIWRLFIQGRIQEIQRMPWKKGYNTI